ncbi:hypothetical protein KSS87_006355 [Heliosperma pusillum]|nr:hypothetical protein KSS87_006355 [Heliosperma pusillum]
MEYLSFIHNLICCLFSSILLMKDRGNSLFKQKKISIAGCHYRQALKFLCFVGLLPSSDREANFSLALSLVLNLAACELKLSHFDLASRYCKFVLHFEHSNVKALYRRGLAYKELNLLKDAHDDFEQVLKLDLNNSEARREILVVADILAVNINGKRAASMSEPLGYVSKGKKPLLSEDVVDKSFQASCSSSSCNTDQMSTDEISNQKSTVSDTIFEVDTPPVAENMDHTTSFVSEKSAKHSFSNKKHAKNKLHISAQVYDNLMVGKDISFFHAGLLSYMRVRPLIPKNSIQTGTPHEDISRVAEVPPSPSLSKEQVEHLTIIPDNATVIQEEVAFQITKKKRISSEVSQVS